MDMFKILREDQDGKFSEILQSNNEIKAAMDFMSIKYDDMVLKVQSVQDENKNLSNRVQFLENQLEIQNRNARCTSIEIRNVPPQGQKETKTELKHVVKNIADTLNIPLENLEIKDIYRINTKSIIKPIIADFTTVFTRDNFLSSYKKFNREHYGGEKLSTTSIKVSGQSKPIYISENLTQRDRRMYYLARQFATAHSYSFCWAAYGKIYVRKSEGDPPIRISSESDIENLRVI